MTAYSFIQILYTEQPIPTIKQSWKLQTKAFGDHVVLKKKCPIRWTQNNRIVFNYQYGAWKL